MSPKNIKIQLSRSLINTTHAVEATKLNHVSLRKDIPRFVSALNANMLLWYLGKNHDHKH